MLRLIITVGIVLAILYTMYALTFFAVQRRVLFPRHFIPPSAGMEKAEGLTLIPLEMPFGTVEAWFLPPMGNGAGTPAPALILTHGNATLIDGWPPRVDALRRMGIGVLLVEYPGYGRSAGVPTQATISATLLKAYDWLVAQPDIDAARIVLFGRSVGGGAICTLAAQRPSAALILLSTFTSVRDMTAGYRLPARLVRDPFDNRSVVQQYAQPLLILHGTQDEVVPYAHSLELHEASSTSTHIPLDCGHNDCITDFDAFWQSLRPFLVQVGVLME